MSSHTRDSDDADPNMEGREVRKAKRDGGGLGKLGKNIKKGTKVGAKGVIALPGATAKGVGAVGKGVGTGVRKGTKLGVKGVTALPGAAKKGAKVGTRGVSALPGATVTGVRLGARGIKALPGVTVTGVRVGAKLGLKGVTNLPSATVTGAKAGVKGIVALPGAAIKGVTALPGAVSNLPANVVTGAKLGVKGVAHHINGKRPLVRQDSTQAWKSRMTSPCTLIDLIFECHGLPKKDSFSQADAFCVLWEAPAGYTGNSNTKGRPSRLPTRQETEIGHTEIVSNCNPRFTTTFRREFHFQMEQTYVVRVYDKDLRFATDLKEHDYLGGAVFTLGQLMGGEGNTIARPLGATKGNKTKSYLIITGREMNETREFFEFRFSGEDLFSPHDVLDIVDPYFKIETLQDDDQTWDVVWKSEVIKANNCPTWKEARLPLQMLMTENQESDRLLQITLWDYDKIGDHLPLGKVEVTIDDLVKGSQRGIPVYDVVREKKKIFRGNKTKKAGVLKVLKATISTAPSMLQYISGGCEIDLTIAVDFTKKNGPLHSDESLHHRSKNWLNDYQAAIHKIGTICEPYSKKKRFAILGFGAQVHSAVNSPENKWFFPMAERAVGADGLLKAYDNTLDNKQLLFQAKIAVIKPVIQAAVYRAIRIAEKRNCYCILCILTAGKIADIKEVTADIVTAAEDAPISIVFIGVGESDQMEENVDEDGIVIPTSFDVGGRNIDLKKLGDIAGIGEAVGKLHLDQHVNTIKTLWDDKVLNRRHDNFSALEMLCEDARGRKEYASSKLMNSNGVPIGRNIVNFAKFEDNELNSAKVVAEALMDIPEQIVTFFVTNGVHPKPPLPAPDFTKDTVYSNGADNNSNDNNNNKKTNNRIRQ